MAIWGEGEYIEQIAPGNKECTSVVPLEPASTVTASWIWQLTKSRRSVPAPASRRMTALETDFWDRTLTVAVASAAFQLPVRIEVGQCLKCALVKNSNRLLFG
jgi:hypothetical protein